MASILVYTSPARGHLYPMVGVSLELRSRGHDVHLRTLAGETDRLRDLGLTAQAIAPGIEARELDDWRAKSPIQALELSMKTFADRAPLEADEVLATVQENRPDLLVVDINSWGAQAAAEAAANSHCLPWVIFQPYFTFLPARGVPPFGPGLVRSTTGSGQIRDSLLSRMLFSRMNRFALPAINGIRTRLGLDPLSSITATLQRPSRILYFTTQELDYPRDSWPDNYRFVGPGLWAPPAATPEWLAKIDRPIALVTCSTERQSDRSIVETALKSLPNDGLFVVATSAAHELDGLATHLGAGGRLERFVPHGPVVERAEVVVCHGGMGITQRALASGVPVVVIPFGRDQLEVARRIEHARAGVRLSPKDLNPETLARAVRQARTMREGARRIAAAIEAAGGAARAADCIEELLGRRQ